MYDSRDWELQLTFSTFLIYSSLYHLGVIARDIHYRTLIMMVGDYRHMPRHTGKLIRKNTFQINHTIAPSKVGKFAQIRTKYRAHEWNTSIEFMYKINTSTYIRKSDEYRARTEISFIHFTLNQVPSFSKKLYVTNYSILYQVYTTQVNVNITLNYCCLHLALHITYSFLKLEWRKICHNRQPQLPF